MKKYFQILLTALGVLLISGCTTTPANDKALGDSRYSVSLEDALASVGTGLSKMVENKGDANFGLAVSEVEVKFNLAIKANDTNKAAVNGEVGGGSKKVTTDATEQKNTNTNSDKVNSSGKETVTTENGSSESSQAKESSGVNSSESSNKASSTNETGLTGKATLVVEKGASLDSDRSNNVVVRFVGIPVLVEKLSIEKLNFLKDLGYFSSGITLLDKDGKPLGLLNGKLDAEKMKNFQEIFKGLVIKRN